MIKFELLANNLKVYSDITQKVCPNAWHSWIAPRKFINYHYHQSKRLFWRKTHFGSIFIDESTISICSIFCCGCSWGVSAIACFSVAFSRLLLTWLLLHPWTRTFSICMQVNGFMNGVDVGVPETLLVRAGMGRNTLPERRWTGLGRCPETNAIIVLSSEFLTNNYTYFDITCEWAKWVEWFSSRNIYLSPLLNKYYQKQVKLHYNQLLVAELLHWWNSPRILFNSRCQWRVIVRFFGSWYWHWQEFFIGKLFTALRLFWVSVGLP